MLLLLFGVADAVVVGVVAAVTAEKLMDYVRSVAVSCVAAAFLICDQRRRLEDRPLRCTTYVNNAPTVPMYPYVPSTYVVYRHMAIHVLRTYA